MTAIESTRKSSKIKERYEKHEKFVGRRFFSSLYFFSGISENARTI